MQRRDVGILCMQETHKKNSDYYVTAEGFLVVLSGSAGEGREHAGVGFLIAPWFRKCIVGFTQKSARLASLKIRVEGGKLVIVNGYAPIVGILLMYANSSSQN